MDKQALARMLGQACDAADDAGYSFTRGQRAALMLDVGGPTEIEGVLHVAVGEDEVKVATERDTYWVGIDRIAGVRAGNRDATRDGAGFLG